MTDNADSELYFDFDVYHRCCNHIGIIPTNSRIYLSSTTKTFPVHTALFLCSRLFRNTSSIDSVCCLQWLWQRACGTAGFRGPRTFFSEHSGYSGHLRHFIAGPRISDFAWTARPLWYLRSMIIPRPAMCQNSRIPAHCSLDLFCICYSGTDNISGASSQYINRDTRALATEFRIPPVKTLDPKLSEHLSPIPVESSSSKVPMDVFASFNFNLLTTATSSEESAVNKLVCLYDSQSDSESHLASIEDTRLVDTDRRFRVGFVGFCVVAWSRNIPLGNSQFQAPLRFMSFQ